MNGFSGLNLFFIKVLQFIVRQYLRKHQNTIKWCSQLVRHICQKFRFVSAGHFKVLSFFLDLFLCLLQFIVFSPDIVALFLYSFCPFFQFFVGNPKFFLLGLQLLFRFFKGSGLFLQLFVCLPEFFLLYLKFFSLLLGFGQQILQICSTFRSI